MSTTTTRSLTISATHSGQAQDLSAWLAELDGPVVLDGETSGVPSRHEMPRELQDLLRQVITTVGRGGSVRLSQFPEELTTTVAAELIGISRPTLMKLVHRGELNAHKVGSHTRLRSKDVLAFAEQRKLDERNRRLRAFDALRDTEAALDD